MYALHIRVCSCLFVNAILINIYFQQCKKYDLGSEIVTITLLELDLGTSELSYNFFSVSCLWGSDIENQVYILIRKKPVVFF